MGFDDDSDFGVGAIELLAEVVECLLKVGLLGVDLDDLCFHLEYYGIGSVVYNV